VEGDNGFARAGGHCEQHAAFALQDGLDGGIDGNLLVVTRFLAGGQIGRSQQALRNRVVRESFPGAKP